LVEFLWFLIRAGCRCGGLAALPLAPAPLPGGFQQQHRQASHEATAAVEQPVHSLDEVRGRGHVAVLHSTDVGAGPAAARQRGELLLRQACLGPKVVERVTELPDRRAGRIDGSKLPTVRQPPFTPNAADRKHRFLLAARAEGVFLFRTNIAFPGPLWSQ
jgi:hypothetical protein